MAIMDARITIDKAGRVVLPKPLREELQLAPGDMLELQSFGEEITLRPVRPSLPVAKERGVWVFRTDEPLAATVTNDILRDLRERRGE
jgi:AbrB family looped-hinge helix DNA binding protein